MKIRALHQILFSFILLGSAITASAQYKFTDLQNLPCQAIQDQGKNRHMLELCNNIFSRIGTQTHP